MHPEGVGAKTSAKQAIDVSEPGEPSSMGGGAAGIAERAPAGAASLGERSALGAPSALVPSVWLRVFTLQDGILLTYLAIVTVLLWLSPPSPLKDSSARGVYAVICAMLFGCFLGRWVPDVPNIVRAVVYRVVVVGAIIYDYLALRDLLPIIRPDSVDAQLLAIDKAIFGVEPALWMERWNTRPIVEWFSFFYFSYFFICVGYMVVSLCLTRINKHTSIYAIGTAMVYCIGQLGYMLVPGYGPIRYLEHEFKAPVNGGFWWSCVWETVQAGSAMKDIFPSLHTAAPLWFTLYALNRAKDEPRWLWPGRISLFFSINIIISTVFLRWHYAIDVFAGLCLAFGVRYAAPRLIAWEEQRRARFGSQGVWVLP
jgi:membrane-associated phospholipid phosphatase